MTKDVEHQQNAQQPMYPTQMPSAPPSYDEAINGPQVNQPYGPYANPPYPTQATPYPTQATSAIHTPHGVNEGYITAAGTYVQPSIVEIQRTVVALPLGPNPARIKCPNCHYDIRTSIDSEPSCAAHLCCLLLLLIGCCPFSSLPYCMDSLKNVRHSCPNCRMVLGSYQP